MDKGRTTLAGGWIAFAMAAAAIALVAAAAWVNRAPLLHEALVPLNTLCRQGTAPAATERAARQAADLTKQMLGFARRQPLRTATVDLNALVREALVLLRRSIDPRITVQFLPAE